MHIVSAAEAVSGIQSEQQLYVQGAGATPSVLLDALVARGRDDPADVTPRFRPREREERTPRVPCGIRSRDERSRPSSAVHRAEWPMFGPSVDRSRFVPPGRQDDAWHCLRRAPGSTVVP